ncbi:uncharacterized protein LOC141655473 [Silene latifolia]|uniref:uncharacterized protein LOC141655473 n=1 Tax=Silene latifolia TaxID=37657 RepID=UPI003D783836
MGDFNNVLHMDERIGSSVTYAEVKEFQDCVDSCGLGDLYASGAFFTWNNKQAGLARVYSRIDRILANDEWLLSGPEGTIVFLPEGLYDHSPCVMDLWHEHVKPKPRFHYFYMWGKCDDFLNVVVSIWSQHIPGYKMFQLAKKMKMLKHPLKQLNQQNFDNIEVAAHVAEALLCEIQSKVHLDPYNDALHEEERVASKAFHELDTARRSFLVQKSKAH